ncbi:MAG: hypothetical protein MR936_05195 [Eubacterium sp.]|nr:hypothetical protein [Eubacterium sp.]
MKTENIIKILVEERNYDKFQTERLAAKIEALPDEIKTALVEWINSGKLSSPEYNGFTVEQILKAKPRMTVLAAYLALDWIRKDPNVAIKAILAPVMTFTPNAKK